MVISKPLYIILALLIIETRSLFGIEWSTIHRSSAAVASLSALSLKWEDLKPPIREISAMYSAVVNVLTAISPGTFDNQEFWAEFWPLHTQLQELAIAGSDLFRPEVLLVKQLRARFEQLARNDALLRELHILARQDKLQQLVNFGGNDRFIVRVHALKNLSEDPKINPELLEEASIQKIRNEFRKNDRLVHIDNFFARETFDSILEEVHLLWRSDNNEAIEANCYLNGRDRLGGYLPVKKNYNFSFEFHFSSKESRIVE